MFQDRTSSWYRHKPVGTHLVLLLVKVAHKWLRRQDKMSGKCPNQTAGRMREKNLLHLEAICRKCYVMEFIRFLLFPLQTASTRVYTPTQDASLTNLDKHMLTYLRYGDYSSCGTVKHVMHIFLRAGRSQVFTCCSLHCCKMLLHKAPDNIL